MWVNWFVLLYSAGNAHRRFYLLTEDSTGDIMKSKMILCRVRHTYWKSHSIHNWYQRVSRSLHCLESNFYFRTTTETRDDHVKVFHTFLLICGLNRLCIFIYLYYIYSWMHIKYTYECSNVSHAHVENEMFGFVGLAGIVNCWSTKRDVNRIIVEYDLWLLWLYFCWWKTILLLNHWYPYLNRSKAARSIFSMWFLIHQIEVLHE